MGLVLKMRATKVSEESNAWGHTSPVHSNRVELSAVGGPGNEEWSQATPSGKLEANITNPDAFGQIEAGRDYIVRIDPAPSGEAAE